MSFLLVIALLFTSLAPVYASTVPPQQVVLPQGQQLDDTEMSEIKGEVSPHLIGAGFGGATSVVIQAVDNILDGKRGIDILDGCGGQFVAGAVMGAILPPTTKIHHTIGPFSATKVVYDYSQAGKSAGVGLVGKVVSEIYDWLTD